MYFKFNMLIDWINKYKFLDHKINIKPICNKPISENAWFSGFIELHTSFQIRYTPKNINRKKDRFAVYFEVTSSFLKTNFMLHISQFLKTNCKTIIRGNKTIKRVRTSTLESNLILVNYLNTYSLNSSKYLEFKDWEKAILIFKDNNHKTLEGKKQLIKLKSGMNNNRRLFTWNHI
jgi:hypothetical protein